MARRRGRKRHGRKGGKSFPLLLMAPVIPGFVAAYNNRQAGVTQIVRGGVYEVSGVDITGGLPLNQEKVMKTLGLAVIGIVGHKVANKVGINRWVKRATLGYISL